LVRRCGGGVTSSSTPGSDRYDVLPELGVFLVEFGVVVAVDVAVAGGRDRVDGAFALLEARGGDFGCVPLDAIAAV